MYLVDMSLPADALMTIVALLKSLDGALLIITSLAYMSTFIPLAILFLYTLQLFYLRTSRQLRLMDLEAKSPLYTHLLETVAGLSTIRAFGWSTPTLENGLRLLDVSQKPYYLLYCVQRWLTLVLDLFIARLAVVFIALAVSLRSSPAAGAVGIALLNLLKLNSSLAIVITSWTELETSFGAIARLKELEIDTPKEEEGGGEMIVPPAGWPAKGRVVFDHVQASYSWVPIFYLLLGELENPN
jgi:ABC-type multidrug transport system fused ATPase/permease subunit